MGRTLQLPALHGEEGRQMEQRAKSDPQRIIGRVVSKVFGGGVCFNGTVKEFSVKNGYHVRYDDGDEEDLDIEDVLAILVEPAPGAGGAGAQS